MTFSSLFFFSAAVGYPAAALFFQLFGDGLYPLHNQTSRQIVLIGIKKPVSE